MFDELSVAGYIEPFIPNVISCVILASDFQSFEFLSARFPQFIFKEEKTLSSLLECNPCILFEILMEDSIQRYACYSNSVNGIIFYL